jgi:hypothetical protein
MTKQSGPMKSILMLEIHIRTILDKSFDVNEFSIPGNVQELFVKVSASCKQYRCKTRRCSCTGRADCYEYI